jgi:hypothetical protein
MILYAHRHLIDAGVRPRADTQNNFMQLEEF